MNARRFALEEDVSVADAALRGAVAGLLGGIAVLGLGWLVRRGMISTDDTVDEEWERLVRRAAEQAGITLGKRQARIARVIAQLTYSALIGAAYGVARTRRRLRGPIRSALNSGLVHAASVPAIAQAARGARKRPSKRKRRGVSIPVGSAALYGLTTSAAFTALLKRASG